MGIIHCRRRNNEFVYKLASDSGWYYHSGMYTREQLIAQFLDTPGSHNPERFKRAHAYGTSMCIRDLKGSGYTTDLESAWYKYSSTVCGYCGDRHSDSFLCLFPPVDEDCS